MVKGCSATHLTPPPTTGKGTFAFSVCAFRLHSQIFSNKRRALNVTSISFECLAQQCPLIWQNSMTFLRVCSALFKMAFKSARRYIRMKGDTQSLLGPPRGHLLHCPAFLKPKSMQCPKNRFKKTHAFKTSCDPALKAQKQFPVKTSTIPGKMFEIDFL